EIKKKQGGSSQQILSKFVESPGVFLVMTLIGFTICLVFFALQVSNVMAPAWHYLHVSSPWIRLGSEIILCTLLVMVFGEFIPRAIFRAKANTLLSRMA